VNCAIQANGRLGGIGQASGGADAYYGGGGSGGGILLAGAQVKFGESADVNAYGVSNVATFFNPDVTYKSGGGRVAVYTGIFTDGWETDASAWVGENARLYSASQLNALAGVTVNGASNPIDVTGTGNAGTFYVVAHSPPSGTVILCR
jgi:hypothetical protein